MSTFGTIGLYSARLNINPSWRYECILFLDVDQDVYVNNPTIRSVDLLDLNVDQSLRFHRFSVNRPLHSLIARFVEAIDSKIWGAGLEDLFLGVELGVRVPLVTLDEDRVPGLAAGRRGQDLNLVRGRGAHHHRLGHDSPHFAWLQIAENHRHSVLHIRFRDKLD